MIQKMQSNDEDLYSNLDEDTDFINDVIIDEEFGDGDIVESISSEEEEEEDDVDVMFKFNTNNHKIEGKHSLARDTIFKGKVDENVEQSEYFSIQEDNYSFDGLPIEVGSNYEFESKYHEEYIGRLNLSKDVYDLLSEKTELDFSSNRRKPNKQAFNDYYKMLLDKEYATQIIVELKQSGYLSNLNNINFI